MILPRRRYFSFLKRRRAPVPVEWENCRIVTPVAPRVRVGIAVLLRTEHPLEMTRAEFQIQSHACGGPQTTTTKEHKTAAFDAPAEPLHLEKKYSEGTSFCFLAFEGRLRLECTPSSRDMKEPKRREQEDIKS